MANQNDISDNEIRVIGSEKVSVPASEPKTPSRKPSTWLRKWGWMVAGLLAVLAIVAVVFARLSGKAESSSAEPTTVNRVVIDTLRSVAPQESYVEVSDTVINRIPLQMFKPVHAEPQLILGNVSPADTSIVLAAMAADYGYSDGELRVVGAFVYRGEILSKSKSKQGFCAILNHQLVIGKALLTPYFEQCVTEDGDFFRQYALVDDGKVVAPERKQRSVHRALCQIGSDYYVIDSQTAVTLTQFAEALCKLRVETAISLMGSVHAVRWACDKSGRRYEMGDIDAVQPDVASFLIWRKP